MDSQVRYDALALTISFLTVLSPRYIYIPLGGNNNLILATTLVFTFVALWHDLSFRLLAWGWLISLFILPEIVGRKLVPAAKVSR